MTQRLSTPAAHIGPALGKLLEAGQMAKTGPLGADLIELVSLRVSQINGCGYCCELHSHMLREMGQSARRIDLVPAFREAPDFDAREKAALALGEAATRMADRADPVPGALWDAAAAVFDEAELTQLTLNIGLINFWNRINVMAGIPPQQRSA